MAYTLGSPPAKGATVELRLVPSAGGDYTVLEALLGDQSPWHSLIAAGVDFQHVDARGTGTATLHFRNEELAFHFQRAFEHAASMLGTAPPVELEVMNIRMPRVPSPTAFMLTRTCVWAKLV